MIMKRLFQGAAWVLLVAIVVLSVVPPDDRPVTPAPHVVEHWSIFFLMGLAFGLGYVRTPWRQSAELVAFSGAIELVQIAIPGRHSRLSDFVVDAASAAGGVLLTAFMRRRMARDGQ